MGALDPAAAALEALGACEFDFAATSGRLEHMESAAVGSKRYDVAGRVAAARMRLGELQAELTGLEAEEAEAVMSRDYGVADRLKRRTLRLFDEYQSLKALDYWAAGRNTGSAVGGAENFAQVLDAAAEQRVPCRFTVLRETEFGAHVVVAGSTAELGLWDPETALTLMWTESGWTGTVALPLGAPVAFKFVVRAALEPGAPCEWHEGPDLLLEVPDCGMPPTSMDVAATWEPGAPPAGQVWVLAPLGFAAPPPADA